MLLTPQLRASAQAVVSCPRAPSPPSLDGNVTPDEWVASGRLGPFVLLNGGGLPMEATEVRVMYDDAALYVGAILHDSDTDRLKADVTEEDGDVYTDDCFEFFLNAAGAGPDYVHIVVNSAATRFDELGKDRTQNYRWTHGVTVHEDDWSVELAIPFGAGEPPAEGTTWAVGAARHAPRLEEYSTWSGCKSSFHEPESFGTVRFGGTQVSFMLVDIGARRLGANEAYLFVDNATADALEYKTNIRVLGRDRYVTMLHQQHPLADTVPVHLGNGNLRMQQKRLVQVPHPGFVHIEPGPLAGTPFARLFIIFLVHFVNPFKVMPGAEGPARSF